MSRRVVPDTEPIWRALADPTRRSILDLLVTGPRTTGAVTATFPTSRFTVMEHLKVLEEVGLTSTEKRGRERLHHLNPIPLQQVHERWVLPEAAAASSVLLRLDRHLENSMTAPPTPQTSYGIDVRAEHVVAHDPSVTWRALLDLDSWWPACWPDDERLFFEPRLAGRMGTVSRSAGVGDEGRLWGFVTELAPEEALSLDGSMGLPGPVLGQWRMTLDGIDGARTRVVVVHRVLGEVDDADRDGFTRGWTRTLAALAGHADGSAS